MTTRTLRRLNHAGLAQFSSLLARARTGDPADFAALRDDATFTEEIQPQTLLPDFPGDGKREVGKVLYETLSQMASAYDLNGDAGLWAWISLAWIDGLAPLQPSGKRKVLSNYRWIPQTNSAFRYYRHLLITPFLVYRAHHDDPDRAMVLLGGKIQQPGDMNENLASRQDILSSASILGAATRLYFDPSKGKTKRGSADKKGGSVQRFGVLLNQFALTWDFDEKTPDEIVAMLPAEFDRFRTTAPRRRRRKGSPPAA